MLVCLAATLPFVHALDSYFLGDDFGLVWHFSRQHALHALSLFWTSWDAGVYGIVPDELRPIVALTYQIDFFLGAGSPVAFHVTNVALHAANALLVLAIARVVARLSLAASGIGAALFAVLPVHAETVAWTSGRADSIPTLFYLGTFLAYALWRGRGWGWLYGVSLTLFFLALFSKQSAITMVATLALYDVIMLRAFPRAAWTAVKAYVPFVLMTAGYLVLRLCLFGNAVREDSIDAQMLPLRLIAVQERHVELLLSGRLPLHDLPSPARELALLLVIDALFLALLPVYWELRHGTAALSMRKRFLYFGPFWWLVSVTPLVVTYDSPRHLYLATAGVTIVAGVAWDLLHRAAAPLRTVGRIGLAGLFVGCVLGLRAGVAAWTATAGISEQMTRQVEREAAAAPAGTLLVLGAPRTAQTGPPASADEARLMSPPPGSTWLWSWSMPYAVQPPFVAPDVADRVAVVAPHEADCCLLDQWFERTRRTIEVWASADARPPVIVLRWDRTTGAVSRVSAADAPCLRSRTEHLLVAETPDALKQGLATLLDAATTNPGADTFARCD